MTVKVALARPPVFGIRPSREFVGFRGRYHGNKQDYVSRFYKLVRRWRAETAYASSVKELYDHPAFVNIVQMGNLAVPLIIKELRKQPDLLVGALTRITGENPVTQADRGNVYAMAASWIDWYQRRYR